MPLNPRGREYVTTILCTGITDLLQGGNVDNGFRMCLHVCEFYEIPQKKQTTACFSSLLINILFLLEK
jgi:hypothetical protein